MPLSVDSAFVNEAHYSFLVPIFPQEIIENKKSYLFAF